MGDFQPLWMYIYLTWTRQIGALNRFYFAPKPLVFHSDPHIHLLLFSSIFSRLRRMRDPLSKRRSRKLGHLGNKLWLWRRILLVRLYPKALVGHLLHLPFKKQGEKILTYFSRPFFIAICAIVGTILSP